MFTDIFDAVFSSALEVVDNGKGTFTMTNEDGASALFGTVSDTVSSDSYSKFNVEVTT